jgi:hypothetical protein
MVNSHKELQWLRSQGVDEAKLFEDLPKSLQQEIKNFLYLDLVKKVPLFQDTDIQFQYSVSLKIKVMALKITTSRYTSVKAASYLERTMKARRCSLSNLVK